MSVRVPAWRRRAASVASLRCQDKEGQHAMAYTADAVLQDNFKTMGHVRTSNVSAYAPARPQWLTHQRAVLETCCTEPENAQLLHRPLLDVLRYVKLITAS